MIMEKYVFRSIDDAPGYKVINENCPDGYFMTAHCLGMSPSKSVLAIAL